MRTFSTAFYMWEFLWYPDNKTNAAAATNYKVISVGQHYHSDQEASDTASAWGRRLHARRKFGTSCKNQPKITLGKFVKLIGHTCVCNNLTSFECQEHKNRKRKLCNSAENCFEKLVKSHQVNLFLAYFTHLKPQCIAGRSLVGGFCPKHFWRKSQEMLCFGRNPR